MGGALMGLKASPHLRQIHDIRLILRGLPPHRRSTQAAKEAWHMSCSLNYKLDCPLQTWHIFGRQDIAK